MIRKNLKFCSSFPRFRYVVSFDKLYENMIELRELFTSRSFC